MTQTDINIQIAAVHYAMDEVDAKTLNAIYKAARMDYMEQKGKMVQRDYMAQEDKLSLMQNL